MLTTPIAVRSPDVMARISSLQPTISTPPDMGLATNLLTLTLGILCLVLPLLLAIGLSYYHHAFMDRYRQSHRSMPIKH